MGTLLAVTNPVAETSPLAGNDAGKGEPLVAQDTKLTGIIPADRRTTWNPGLNAVGGIPNRTTIYRTLSPRGGSLDDTAAIESALNTCPPGQVVKLSPGTFNINGDGVQFKTPDCTLRGSGTGAPGSGDGGTRLIKADYTNRSYEVIHVARGRPHIFLSSTNLGADAIKGANSLTLVSNPGVAVGEIVLVDQVTDNDPRVWWGPQHNPPGGASRGWCARQDRSLAQVMEVTAVDGNTITFSTPFHITFKTAYEAQLSRYGTDPGVRLSDPVLYRVGIEDMYVHGGRGHGNVVVALCAYCWVKNIESHWSVGSSVSFTGTFRSVLRDSYIHETPDPNPGGAGYLVSLGWGASDNLVENNIMWSGNKNIVMTATGGGNVVAYNYMDDAYGAQYPNMPEGGLNAGHCTTSHMELLEGNYSHNYAGDSFWGNSIYITVFRNHLSGLRAARPPLNTYKFGVYPYMDLGPGRTAVNIGAHSDYTNLVGNVLGFEGQTLLSYNRSGYSYTQTGWEYEELGGFSSVREGKVTMWSIGAQQAGGWTWVPTTYQTQLRQGNWDWVTRSQRWHGIGGAVGSGTPQVIPDSLYLAAKPAFFGANPWPWVDPSSGAVCTLPAKACFEQGKMPTCMLTQTPNDAHSN
jgi:hypothetical protein